MIELPEAVSMANSISKTIAGKRIAKVTAEHTPHKFAWYYGDRSQYSDILEGKMVVGATAHGGFVEIKTERANVLFGEGVNIRFHKVTEPHPSKHQFLVEFEDRTALSAAVQMYGGLGAFLEGGLNNPNYLVAKEKPSPLSPSFDSDHFQAIISGQDVQKMSLKALLATEQRIPGLGNGVLQDILFFSEMHPKKKVNTLNEGDVRPIFEKIKDTIRAMAEQGGRNTEMDLFGRPGGYQTVMSKNTVNKPCPKCGTAIKKEAYLGGSIYYCGKCQRM